MVSRSWLYELRQGGQLLLVGALGALAGHALGLTAGVIAGALVATGAYRLLGGDPGPWQKRYGRAGRLLLGTVIGAAFGPELLAPLQAAVLPMAGLIVVIVAVGLLLGLALSHLTKLDRATSIISAMPGGLPATAALADDAGADATIVASIHFSRLTTILLVVPVLVPLVTGLSGGATPVSSLGEPAGLVPSLTALALGLLGGLLALRVGVPTADFWDPSWWWVVRTCWVRALARCPLPSVMGPCCSSELQWAPRCPGTACAGCARLPSRPQP